MASPPAPSPLAGKRTRDEPEPAPAPAILVTHRIAGLHKSHPHYTVPVLVSDIERYLRAKRDCFEYIPAAKPIRVVIDLDGSASDSLSGDQFNQLNTACLEAIHSALVENHVLMESSAHQYVKQGRTYSKLSVAIHLTEKL